MLAPCHASPAHTFRAAARVAPATSADASCMPGNTPNARASSIVISTRTGAIGCQDPKS